MDQKSEREAEGLLAKDISTTQVKDKRAKKLRSSKKDVVTTISLNLRGTRATKVKSKSPENSFFVDLRVHEPQTVSEIENYVMDKAVALINLASAKRLDAIAITEPYSLEFAYKILAKASKKLTIFPGFLFRAQIVENSFICDDVSICCLFPSATPKESLQKCMSEITGTNTKLENSHTIKLDLMKAVAIVERYSGVCYPTKMDQTPLKKACLPILVEKYGFRSFDMAYGESFGYLKHKYPNLELNLFKFSAATTLAQAGNHAAQIQLTELNWQNLARLFARKV